MRDEASESATTAEAAAADFLERNGDIVTVDLLLADLAGILRGKRLPAASLARVLAGGVALPGSVYGLDITGTTVEATGLGLHCGDADRICRVVPGRLARVPWQARPTAEALIAMTGPDGDPFFADPRAQLQRQVERLADRGLTAVVAMELEFYLIEGDRDADAAPRPAPPPGGGRRQTTTQVYGLDELDDFGDLLGEIGDCCAAMGIPVDGATAEYAPGQYEINLSHRASAVAAADDAVLFKRVVRKLAARHGVTATFMSKPFADLAGSGLHVHLSLLDRQGSNIFAADDPAGTPALGHAIGGLLAGMGDGQALFAANQNAFRRFRADSYAPLAATWGIDNRTVAVRVPAGPAASRRLEHRVAGSDANPYLVLAAVLGAVEQGLEQRLDPGPPETGDAYRARPPDFGSSWAQALDRLAGSAFYEALFGRPFLDVYLAVKRAERDRFHQHVSPLEYQWYLDKG